MVVPIDFEVKWEGGIEDVEDYNFATETELNPDGTIDKYRYNIVESVQDLDRLLLHCDKARVKVVEEFRNIGNVVGRATQGDDPNADDSIVMALKRTIQQETIIPRYDWVVIHEYGHNADTSDLTSGHRYDDGSAPQNIMNAHYLTEGGILKSREVNHHEGDCYIEEKSD